MARPRSKPAGDLTNDEALRKLFPKPVVRKAKREAQKADKSRKVQESSESSSAPQDKDKA